MIILEKHPVSGYEPRHHRRKPDDVLTHTEQRRQRITFGAAAVAVAAGPLLSQVTRSASMRLRGLAKTSARHQGTGPALGRP